MASGPSTAAAPRRLNLPLLLLCAWAAYAGTVMLLALAGHWLGRDWPALDRHLLIMALPWLAAAHDGDALYAALLAWVVGLGWWLWRGRQAGPALRAGVAAGLLVGLSVPVAQQAGHWRAVRHAQALAAAVQAADRRQLREQVFRCEVFCGFALDSAPLVWLTRQAVDDADDNAIGYMLAHGAARHARSPSLPDPRSALEVAVDRAAERPALAPYLLGITRLNFHFPVTRAAQGELDAALRRAIRGGAPQALIDELLGNGAQGSQGVSGTKAESD